MNIEDTLAQRGNRYGEFKTNAKIVQDLKKVMKAAPSWGDLRPYQKEALEMVQHKIARILNGDVTYIDSWTDLQGYAKLAVDELIRQNELATTPPLKGLE